MDKIRKKISNLHPALRWALYLVGVLLLLLIVIQIFLTFFIDDYAANYLKEQINKPGSAYSIDFDELNLNVFGGSATIENLRINADTAAFTDTSVSKKPPKTLFRGTVGSVEASGINVFSAAMGDELHISSITISEPDISALNNPNPVPQDSSQQSATLDSTIYAAISDRYSALEIGDFTVREGHGFYTQSGDTLSSLGQLNITLNDIRVDSASARSGRLFITDNFSLDATNFRYQLPDSVNTIAFNKLDISSENRSIALDSLELIPRYPRFEFSRKYGVKLDRIDLIIPELQIQRIDVPALIDSARFHAEKIDIDNFRLEDFLNRSMPGGPPKPKPLPFIAFRNLNQKIKVDTMQITNSYVSYSEYIAQTPQAGTITFEQLDATLYNISNYPKDIQQGITMVMDARTRVMGRGVLNTHFEFPMDTDIGFHSIRGELSSMPFTAFNPMIEYVAFIRLESGTLNRLEFDMRLTEEQSNGDLIMNYENLNISVLDNESLKQQGIMENIKTFLANNIVLNENNTPEAGMQAGHIQFERAQHKSIFNYWWKSLLSGIKSTIK